jgi:hypothetical protein
MWVLTIGFADLYYNTLIWYGFYKVIILINYKLDVYFEKQDKYINSLPNRERLKL